MKISFVATFRVLKLKMAEGACSNASQHRLKILGSRMTFPLPKGEGQGEGEETLRMEPRVR